MALGAKPQIATGSGPAINPGQFGGGGGGFTGPVAPPVPAAPIFDPYNFGASVVVDADGTATIALPVVGALVLIERISVENDGAATSAVGVYVGGIDPKNRLDATSSGNNAIADEVNPIRVRPNATFVVQWTGATAGSTSYLSLQYLQARIVG